MLVCALQSVCVAYVLSSELVLCAAKSGEWLRLLSSLVGPRNKRCPGELDGGTGIGKLPRVSKPAASAEEGMSTNINVTCRFIGCAVKLAIQGLASNASIIRG